MPEFESSVRDFRAPLGGTTPDALAGFAQQNVPRPARRHLTLATTRHRRRLRRGTQRASISGDMGRHHLPGSDFLWRKSAILPQLSPTNDRRGPARG